jgi:hypothetical protein
MESVDSGEAIRNRITHPKTLLSIEIRYDELPLLRDGGQWVYDTYAKLLSSVGTSLEIAQADFLQWLNSVQGEFVEQLRVLFDTPKS